MACIHVASMHLYVASMHLYVASMHLYVASVCIYNITRDAGEFTTGDIKSLPKLCVRARDSPANAQAPQPRPTFHPHITFLQGVGNPQRYRDSRHVRILATYKCMLATWMQATRGWAAPSDHNALWHLLRHTVQGVRILRTKW